MEAKELVNLLYPEHTRTSCSDDNVYNGFSWKLDEWNDRTKELDKQYLPRCKRCALLYIISGKVELTDYNKQIIQNYF